MLLNKHKNYILVGLTALGLVLTVGMAAIGVNLDMFLKDSTITANRFSSYGLINAKTVANDSSNGLKSENITFEFEKPEAGKHRSIKDNGFVSLGYALTDANNKEPSIFNVHGVSSEKSGTVEFLFESLSPTDYESKVFYQAFTPFTRLANSAGFKDVKYISTIGDNGARHVVIETTSNGGRLTGKDADDLWRQMLIVLSPMSENTSYDLTLTLEQGITVHGTLSTKAEQDKMMEYDPNNNWDSVFSLMGYPGVQSIDLYTQGNDIHDNTAALNVTQPASVPDYVKTLTDFASNKANKFPRDFTTTATVEGEGTPIHVLYPQR
jgi:hypothetical protein